MKQEKLERLIQELIDSRISTEDLEALEKELTTNSKAMAYYIAYTDLDNLMHVQTDILHHKSSKVVPVERIIRRQKRRALKVATLSAAAILLLCMVAMRLFFVSEKQPTLVFKTSPGTLFSIAHSNTHKPPEGLVLEKGTRLQITHGFVELSFRSGVKSIITAPADLTLHHEDLLYLNYGTAWFRVPQKAVGFQVRTPNVLVTDLGTEFGVRSSRDALDEVHVFEGEVEVLNLNSLRHKELLSAKQARIIGPAGRLKAISPSSGHFHSSLPTWHMPNIVFQDQFNSGATVWTINGNVDFAAGDYAVSTCDINTSGKDDHSDIHFNQEGIEIPADGKNFVALGNRGAQPVSSISTVIPVTLGETYTVYFRYAGSHNEHQRITSTISLGSDSASSGQLEAPDKTWASTSFTFTPRSTGQATLKFEDTGSSEGERSDPLIDSVMITSVPTNKSPQLPTKK